MPGELFCTSYAPLAVKGNDDDDDDDDDDDARYENGLLHRVEKPVTEYCLLQNSIYARGRVGANKVLQGSPT